MRAALGCAILNKPPSWATATILPSTWKGKLMQFADLCLFLGALFAFATLGVKVIEVSRKD